MSDKEVVTGPGSLDGLSWDGWRPDIVVGVDFGMTYTGVAYSMAPDWFAPKTIQRWPGKLPGELSNKVPTCLEYAADTDTVTNWGFLCDPEDRSARVKEFFKLHLSAQYQDEYLGSPSRQEARRWFQDYIQCVYNHVASHFSSTIPAFGALQVEFIFSVPTTWKDVRMIHEIRELLEQAINAKSPRHRAFIGLTEAEAAAVYAGHGHYQIDDTILVCDSGGGTTDVNALRLMSSSGEPTRLEPLGNVEGQPVGSVFIDREMHRLICERLEKVAHHLRCTPADEAWRMISGRFQRLKCAYGTEATSTPWLKLDVPSLGPESDLPEADIYSGQMQIAWDDVKKCFDSRIDEIFLLLDSQIHQLRAKYPDDSLSYLVLSGGFGSSPYVRQRLLNRYNRAGEDRHSNTKDMQILLADEPQLVVVHGLVLERIQYIKRGIVTFGSRCCPVSYGIICDKVYDPILHLGEPVRHDARDKRMYAANQVEWLVIKDQAISHAGVTKDFQIKLEPGEEDTPWKAQIVMSTLPPDRLPPSMSHPGVQMVCTLKIPTQDVDRKLKNRHWYSSKPAFWRLSFDVKVIVGPADLSFQLWSKDRRIRSSKHDPIAVNWMPADDVRGKK